MPTDSVSTPARILVVEDQDDLRRMLVTALEIDGYAVDEASNAMEGLSCLDRSRYDLILSDYAMPGGTGTWMLHEAARRGLMRRALAVIVTAQPDVRELAGVEVIPKPLDLDNFLRQVRRLLDDSEGTAGRSSCASPEGERVPQHKVELVLYISSASPASIMARRNLERLLNRFDKSQIKVTICDLGQDPLAGEEDRIAFTPTLVKRHPEPKMWVLGNLRDPEILADIFRVSGVDDKA